MSPEDIASELTRRYELDYPTEAARKKAVLAYIAKTPGLLIALFRAYETGSPVREAYRKCLVAAAAYAVIMTFLLIFLLANYSGFELDAILASPSLKSGFLVAVLSATCAACMAAFSAFRARAVLTQAVFEQIKGVVAARHDNAARG